MAGAVEAAGAVAAGADEVGVDAAWPKRPPAAFGASDAGAELAGAAPNRLGDFAASHVAVEAAGLFMPANREPAGAGAVAAGVEDAADDAPAVAAGAPPNNEPAGFAAEAAGWIDCAFPPGKIDEVGVLLCAAAGLPNKLDEGAGAVSAGFGAPKGVELGAAAFGVLPNKVEGAAPDDAGCADVF